LADDGMLPATAPAGIISGRGDGDMSHPDCRWPPAPQVVAERRDSVSSYRPCQAIMADRALRLR
jgi:hypothetical protein